MIIRLLCNVSALVLLASCSGHDRGIPPELAVISQAKEIPQKCAAVFPRGQWQFIHSIVFQMVKGGGGSLLGVIALDNDEIRCALMTVEGLTLFEARSMEDGSIRVTRALPPFDNRNFAVGMMRDVRTIFRPPSGRVEHGLFRDTTAVCRYSSADGVTDILPQEDGCWSISAYAGKTGQKTIQARSCRSIGSSSIPGHLELIASGPAGYSLNMQLISAERLTAGN